MADEEITPETILRWHQRFAAQCNNRAWDLADQPERTPGEEDEMLAAAYAAAYHWFQVGAPLNMARADVTLAHVLSSAGQGQFALHYARRCLDYFEQHACEDWDAAFAHAEIAFAAAVLKDEPLHARHRALARQLGQEIEDEQDRQVFLDVFNKMPVV